MRVAEVPAGSEQIGTGLTGVLGAKSDGGMCQVGTPSAGIEAGLDGSGDDVEAAGDGDDGQSQQESSSREEACCR